MVADHLGYPWKFIELTHKIIQNDYVSDKHNDYLSFSNTFSSVQVEHEFSAVRLLKESNWVSDDAIFINELAATLEDKAAGFDGASKLWDKVRKDINWFRQHNADAYMVLLD